MGSAPGTAPEYSKGLRALASSYRTRLFLAILLVVAVVLGLVLLSLPRLLEGFLLEREQTNLTARAQATSLLIADELARISADGAFLLLEGPGFSTEEALRDDENGLLQELTESVAGADLTVRLAPAAGEAAVYRIVGGAPGRRRQRRPEP